MKRYMSIAAIGLGGIMLAGCASLPQDDANLEKMHFDGVRGTRYTEMFLIGGNGITKNMKAGVYNSIGLNYPEGGPIDSSPQAILDKMDLKAMKKEFKVLGVYKNGPRVWCLDWVDVNTGAEKDFQGLKARWVMLLDVPKDLGAPQEKIAYKPMTGKRTTHLGINKGSPAFLLDDPEGNSWCMKSMSMVIDPNQKYEDLKDLAPRLQLPDGWTYRAVTLEKDLVLTPKDGVAHITQDMLGNTYDRVGGPFSNYKP